jgi:hypothetical protein
MVLKILLYVVLAYVAFVALQLTLGSATWVGFFIGLALACAVGVAVVALRRRTAEE